MKKLSKRQKAIREKVELEKQYSLEEALQLLQLLHAAATAAALGRAAPPSTARSRPARGPCTASARTRCRRPPCRWRP